MDPFEVLAGARAPRQSTREERVVLLGQAAQALLAGRAPSPEAALFLGGALAAWLAQGGSLENFLRVHQRGSHATPQRIWGESLIDDDDGARKGGLRSDQLQQDRGGTP